MIVKRKKSLMSPLLVGDKQFIKKLHEGDKKQIFGYINNFSRLSKKENEKQIGVYINTFMADKDNQIFGSIENNYIGFSTDKVINNTEHIYECAAFHRNTKRLLNNNIGIMDESENADYWVDFTTYNILNKSSVSAIITDHNQFFKDKIKTISEKRKIYTVDFPTDENAINSLKKAVDKSDFTWINKNFSWDIFFNEPSVLIINYDNTDLISLELRIVIEKLYKLFMSNADSKNAYFYLTDINAYQSETFMDLLETSCSHGIKTSFRYKNDQITVFGEKSILEKVDVIVLSKIIDEENLDKTFNCFMHKHMVLQRNVDPIPPNFKREYQYIIHREQFDNIFKSDKIIVLIRDYDFYMVCDKAPIK